MRKSRKRELFEPQFGSQFVRRADATVLPRALLRIGYCLLVIAYWIGDCAIGYCLLDS